MYHEQSTDKRIIIILLSVDCSWYYYQTKGLPFAYIYKTERQRVTTCVACINTLFWRQKNFKVGALPLVCVEKTERKTTYKL